MISGTGLPQNRYVRGADRFCRSCKRPRQLRSDKCTRGEDGRATSRATSGSDDEFRPSKEADRLPDLARRLFPRHNRQSRGRRVALQVHGLDDAARLGTRNSIGSTGEEESDRADGPRAWLCHRDCSLARSWIWSHPRSGPLDGSLARLLVSATPPFNGRAAASPAFARKGMPAGSPLPAHAAAARLLIPAMSPGRSEIISPGVPI